LDNLDIGSSACDSFVQDDDDDWLCISEHNDEPCPKEEFKDELPEVQAEPQQLQHYTTQQWLEKIEEHYFYERDDLVRKSFQSALHDVHDPFTFTLHVMFKAFFDLYSKRIQIIFYALDELEIFLDIKETNSASIPLPKDNHKEQAMNFICNRRV